MPPCGARPSFDAARGRGRAACLPAIPEEEPVAEFRRHVPVLLLETVAWLAPRSGDVVLDATVGQGGHAEALLERIGPAGRLVGIDRDPGAVRAARRRLARFGAAFAAVHGNHRDLARLASDAGVERADRIVFDLGFSSDQLEDPERGFSFALDGPLDMRLDPTTGPCAADLVAALSEEELAQILWSYGEERRARAIARAIVGERDRGPLARTLDLARLVERVAGAAAQRRRIHPATRTFMALRIAVNDELETLRSTLVDAVRLLRAGGRIAFISFHSLEDRIVKHGLRELARPCICPPSLPVCGCGRQSVVRVLTPRPVRPTDDELAGNPRARSARLRVAEKT